MAVVVGDLVLMNAFHVHITGEMVIVWMSVMSLVDFTQMHRQNTVFLAVPSVAILALDL